MTPRKKSAAAGIATRKSGKKATGQLSGTQELDKAGKDYLSRERIIRAAMAIVDSDGFEALSMRRLGKALGVDPMSVYYHIPNKSALLDALVEVVMSSIDLNLDDPGRTPEERLLTAGYTYRQALLSHPNLIQAVCCRAPRTPASLRPVEVLISIFVDAGFSHDDAFSAMNVLAAYVRGAVIREVADRREPQDAAAAKADFSQLSRMLPPGEFPHLSKVDTGSGCFEPEAIFDRGIRALIRGLLELYGNTKEAREDV